ncbi:SUMF1/EgtB/PvdO family nonheme iron enzyme [Aquabacterium sp. CECT 9606]|uniref:SUMF1/EgtB/PvdO family nonheme iron enzyme n=1 Tax=Aquabacterium sp. CECT 9606 TaxID=2845822 RepID=UPI001E375B03|nr:SUMF1/EgtB/PvdO family nonheme iron enzyme [Aquabacterium sp. CECT 9606]CAH0353139.1 Hercynine oxygenase [Aquabacterium sp. CECT 9606]
MSELTDLQRLRAASAEMLGPSSVAEEVLASLGTAFLIDLRDPSDAERKFAITAHHCVAEAHALGQDADMRLRFDHRTVGVRCVVGVDSYLTGGDIAILELSEDPLLEPLPCAMWDLEELSRATFLVRGCASGMRTQFSNLWGRVAGVESLRSDDAAADRIDMLELAAEVFTHEQLRGISGAPVCIFSHEQEEAGLFVVGLTREVGDRRSASGRFYGTPLERMARLCHRIGLTLAFTRESGRPLQGTSELRPRPAPLDQAAKMVRTFAGSLVDAWQSKTSPILPVGVALPSVAVDICIRDTAGALPRLSSGYQRDLSPLALREKLTLADLIRKRRTRRAFVLGDPGSGKTTMLQMEAARLGALAREGSGELPVLLSLAEFEASHIRDVSWSLEDAVEALGKGLSIQGMWSVVSRYLDEGRLVLLLDGFDEVTEFRRDELLLRLLSQLARHEGNVAIVASRKVGFRAAPEFSVWEIAPFRHDQQRSLLLPICGPVRCAFLLRSIAGNPDLRDLAGMPLTLSLLGLLANEEEGELGVTLDKRSALFETAVQMLLEGRHRGGRGMRNPEAAEGILAQLSYDLHAADSRAPSEVYTGRQIESLLVSSSGPALRQAGWQGARDYLAELTSNTGLLLPVDALRRAFRYLHRGFREYLCARALSSLSLVEIEEFVRDRVDDPQWAEVLVFYAGMSALPSRYVLELLRGPPGLALRALAEVSHVDSVTALQILQLPDTTDMHQRQTLFEQLESLLAPNELIGVLRTYHEAMGSAIPRGDLHFIRQACLRSGGSRVSTLLADLFKHIPPPPDDLFDPIDLGSDRLPYWCEVPAGPFELGAAADDPLKPPWVCVSLRADLPKFRIGRVAITNRIYSHFDPALQAPALFVEAADGASLAEHPAVGISWFEADIFCRWASQRFPGIRLPTELEWEKAASWDASSDRKYRYPWGDDWNPSLLNSWESGPGMTTPVGMYPGGASPCGALDMAGNVWEWCANCFIDIADLEIVARRGGRFPEFTGEQGLRRVDRGGGWYHDVGAPATFLRAADDPADRFEHCGLRVVQDDSAAS